MKLHHYKQLDELCLASNYKTILILDNSTFIGYDTIQHNWAVVYFLRTPLEVMLDPNREPIVFNTEKDAIKYVTKGHLC